MLAGRIRCDPFGQRPRDGLDAAGAAGTPIFPCLENPRGGQPVPNRIGIKTPGNDIPPRPDDPAATWRYLAHLLTLGQRQELFLAELESAASPDETRELLLETAERWVRGGNTG
jgi:hypothetical protein